MYTWGQDVNGCLGLGKMKHQYFPLRVSIFCNEKEHTESDETICVFIHFATIFLQVGLGSAAKKISLGIDHTLVIAKGL